MKLFEVVTDLKVFETNKVVTLENGKQLINPVVAYHTFGSLNSAKSNVIWVCHALTANSNVFEWWPGFFGLEEVFNPTDHFIVCANILGSHYGTTGPLSINPTSGTTYFHEFPNVTVRDMITLHKLLADHLGIQKINTIIGGSLGGQQSLEWAVQEPDRIDNLVAIATNAIHSPWGVAFNESQRMAIESDHTWFTSDALAGVNGMKIARSIALLSYRNYLTYEQSQQPTDSNMIYPDRAASYQKYQGEKLARRFNAYSYWHLSKAMDSQNVGRNRGGLEKALGTIKANTIVITLEGDVLFPQNEQKFIAENIPNAKHILIPSLYGHDGFLIEVKRLSEIFK